MAVSKACGFPPFGREPPSAAYNIKQVPNLVSFEKLMAAVGVKVPQSV